MIRWYDYILAILAADFLFANMVYAIVADSLLGTGLGILGVAAMWYIWGDYCEWRKKRETQE